ncbi:MAG: transglycosylase SLT domain-containing protein [Bacteroidales bacterium]|nr:transglycosylase SLT domain-containing protein [Bacteroidales bacterium]
MNNLRIYTVLFSMFVSVSALLAETPDKENKIVKAKDTIRDESVVLPESLSDSNIDSLLCSWTIRQQVFSNQDCLSREENPDFSDEEYIQRLSELPTIIEMPYNQIVRSFIDVYTNRRRSLVQYMLGMGEYYFSLFEQELDANNMPHELKYLPVIESALNPTAVSRAGATGLWQFMLGTGKMYGLECNSLVDERRDPVRSTHAAVRYLKDLYDIYQDWNLAISAYNCGPGNVNKAIKRAGGKKDFWEIYNYLPKETRGYLPAFIAANYVMNYYSDHNICPATADLSYSSDTIEVKTRIHLQQIADVLDIPIDELRSLNPQYKKDIIPGGENYNCMLRLPMTCAYNFIEMQDSICNYHQSELLANRTTVEPAAYNKKAANSLGIKTFHKVRSGETLSQIAGKYHVTVNQLKSWNNLRNTRINIGQKLVLYKG